MKRRPKRESFKKDLEATEMARFMDDASWIGLDGRWHLYGADMILLRKACLFRDRNKCTKCGRYQDPEYLDMHHDPPLSKGGHDHIDWVTTRCKFGDCHHAEHPQVKWTPKEKPNATEGIAKQGSARC